MFERFGSEAKETVHLAQVEADRLRHSWLGTEHLLLGLLRQPGTGAVRVLAGLGVTFESVERELLADLGEPDEDAPLDDADARALQTLGIDLGEVRRRVEDAFGTGALERGCGRRMCPRLKESLQRATDEAGRALVETDHLLLGMVQVRHALAVEILDRLGVSADTVRANVQMRRRAS